MLIALYARDREGASQIRADSRAAHLGYIEQTGVVNMAGPLMNDEGGMIGSLVILDVADMAAARDWADNDPYAKADLFERVELTAWKKVIG